MQLNNPSTPISVPLDETSAVDVGVGDIGRRIVHPPRVNQCMVDMVGTVVEDVEDAMVVVVEVDLEETRQ